VAQEIIEILKEMRSEIVDNRILLERNTVTLEEHARRSLASESRIKIMEDHIFACPARSNYNSTENLWKRIKNYAVILAVAATILTQLLPWWRAR